MKNPKKLAKAEADALLAKLDGTTKLSGNDATKELTVEAKPTLERFTSDVDSTLRTELFKMAHPEAGTVNLEVIQLSNGDYALAALVKVTNGTVPEDVSATEQRLASQYSQMSYRSFVGALKEGADIEKLAIATDAAQQ